MSTNARERKKPKKKEISLKLSAARISWRRARARRRGGHRSPRRAGTWPAAAPSSAAAPPLFFLSPSPFSVFSCQILFIVIPFFPCLFSTERGHPQRILPGKTNTKMVRSRCGCTTSFLEELEKKKKGETYAPRAKISRVIAICTPEK